MTFGERIQQLRREKGLTQEALAEKLAVTRQTISKWELDQSTPELDYIARLSELFEVSTDYLIKGDERTRETSDPEPVVQTIENHVHYPPTAPEATKERILSTVGICLGFLLTCIGLVGMLAFVILSQVHPWTHYRGSHTYTGLPGYLFSTSSWLYFIGLAVLAVIGLALIGVSVYFLIKRKNMPQRENRPAEY